MGKILYRHDISLLDCPALVLCGVCGKSFVYPLHFPSWLAWSSPGWTDGMTITSVKFLILSCCCLPVTKPCVLISLVYDHPHNLNHVLVLGVPGGVMCCLKFGFTHKQVPGASGNRFVDDGDEWGGEEEKLQVLSQWRLKKVMKNKHFKEDWQMGEGNKIKINGSVRRPHQHQRVQHHQGRNNDKIII